MMYGIQMYSLQDVVPVDMERALKTVSEIGYQAVEFAGFAGHPASEIKEWLQKYHLTPWASHLTLDDLRRDFDGIVAYHREIGCPDLGISSIFYKTEAELEDSINGLNEMLPRLEKEGLGLYFHNHAWDFYPNRANAIPIQQVITRTAVKLEIDSYWAFMGGVDPITLMERLRDRIAFIHLKDGVGGFNGRSLGQGVAPVEKVHQKAKELGYRMIVESESCSPDGPSEVARCYEFLKGFAD